MSYVNCTGYYSYIHLEMTEWFASSLEEIYNL